MLVEMRHKVVEMRRKLYWASLGYTAPRGRLETWGAKG